MDKGQFKAAVIAGVGQKVDDMLEAAKLDTAKQGGFADALLGVSEKIKALATVADEESKEGKFDDLEPLQILALVKQYIIRCDTVIESAAAQAATAKLTCQGRVQALELVVKNLKKEHDFELAKSEARGQAEEAGGELDSRPLPDGSHRAAPPSLKAQRLAEEQAEKTRTEPPKIAQAEVPKKRPAKKRPRKG